LDAPIAVVRAAPYLLPTGFYFGGSLDSANVLRLMISELSFEEGCHALVIDRSISLMSFGNLIRFYHMTRPLHSLCCMPLPKAYESFTLMSPCLVNIHWQWLLFVEKQRLF
jgi:hypothetical protein